MDFSGQVAIVTGGGSGLGRSHAVWLAERGAAVVINNCLRPDGSSSAAAIAEQIVARGGRAIADDHAVEDPAAGEAMVRAALDAFGRVDILVCNAAANHYAPFDALDLDSFRRVVDVNLWGTVYPIRAAWPVMVAQGYGRIVLTSSTGGLYGVANSAPYATSKAALFGLAKALTFDVPAGADIKVNVLAPGALTRALERWLPEDLKSVLHPDLVSPVVGWMASRGCDRSGTILLAAAGKTARIRHVESAPVAAGDDGRFDWATLDSLDDAREPTEVFESLGRLVPDPAMLRPTAPRD